MASMKKLLRVLYPLCCLTVLCAITAYALGGGSNFNAVSPGPIGGTTSSTGQFTKLAVGTSVPPLPASVGGIDITAGALIDMGTTDNNPIGLKANGSEFLRVYPDGSVSIGNTPVALGAAGRMLISNSVTGLIYFGGQVGAQALDYGVTTSGKFGLGSPALVVGGVGSAPVALASLTCNAASEGEIARQNNSTAACSSGAVAT
jgi:hypothetical protein